MPEKDLYTQYVIPSLHSRRQYDCFDDYDDDDDDDDDDASLPSLQRQASHSLSLSRMGHATTRSLLHR